MFWCIALIIPSVYPGSVPFKTAPLHVARPSRSGRVRGTKTTTGILAGQAGGTAELAELRHVVLALVCVWDFILICNFLVPLVP